MVFQYSAASRAPGYDDGSGAEAEEEQEVRTMFIASAAIQLSVRCERVRNRIRRIRAGCRATDHVEEKRGQCYRRSGRINLRDLGHRMQRSPLKYPTVNPGFLRWAQVTSPIVTLQTSPLLCNHVRITAV
jgi:hypothetical protein